MKKADTSDIEIKEQRRKSNIRIFVWLILFAAAMFAFGYAMVPLYNVLCSVFGLNGKTGGQTVAAVQVDTSRWVTVEFIANKNANLPWKFYPLEKKVRVHPGQSRQIAYFAENDSGKTMTVQAIPSLSPSVAAKYMKKTECFCFEQQTLKNKESMDMPMIFHIDVDLPKSIRTVTLSYTLFDTAGIRIKKNKNQGRLG